MKFGIFCKVQVDLVKIAQKICSLISMIEGIRISNIIV